MRRAASILFLVTGAWLWFGPWQVTLAAADPAAGSVQVACAWAPVDLMLYGSDPLGSDAWFGEGSAMTTPAASDACRTSAWWRTILGVLALGIGLGTATRGRMQAYLDRADAADPPGLRPLGT